MNKLINELIILPSVYTISAEADGYARGLMMESSCITAVTDPDSLDTASVMAREIKRHLNDVEAVREQIKRPVIDAGRQIDEVARQYSATLKNEVDRIAGLITGFRVAEESRLATERKRQHEEIERLMQEAKAAKESAAEAQIAATKETDAGSQIAADIAAAQLAQQAEAAAAAAREVIIAHEPAKAKARGAVTGKRLQYEVTDIRLLYAARPDLCRIEENAGAIRAVCTSEMNIPGLRLWEEIKTNIRG